jgi:hypothetical protein
MARPRLSDDYDDFDDTPPGRRPVPDLSSGMSSVKIVAIIAGVVLALALMCGGIGFYAIYAFQRTAEGFQEKIGEQMEKMRKEQERQQKEQENSDKEKSRQFANDFVQELRGGRAEAAYARTTAAYRKRVSLEQLKGLMASQAKALQRFTGFFADPLAPDKGTTFSFTETVLAGGKQRVIRVTAVKAKEAWKVDQFAVEEEERQPREP